MEQTLIKLLHQKHNHLNWDQLQSNFSQFAPDLLQQVLKKLSEEKVIGMTRDKSVYLLDDKTYFQGMLKMNPKGFGFVSNIHDNDNEKNDFFVPPVNLNNAISGDEVIYKLEVDTKMAKPGEPTKYKAVVEGIVSRKNEYLVGEILPSSDGKYLDFHPTNQDFSSFRVFMVNKADFKLQPNLIAKVKVLRSEGRKLITRLVKIIGDANKAADRILSIAEEFNIKTEFNDKTLQEAKIIAQEPDQFPEILKLRQKHSIEDKLLVTIDGIDSKDLDDAIYVEKRGDHYVLIVAIADVSHYVQAKSLLDNEALMRGNSTYLVNVVLPMLPEVLSNGVCSLNPDVTRFCMVAEMEFDANGIMIRKEVYESVMRSQARLNYREVNEFFNGAPMNRSQAVQAMLTNAQELSNLLNQVFEKRGTINFEIREPKIILDANANVAEIQARTTGEAEKLIENFMVSANEAVAQTIFEKELPFVYRNHGKPKEEDLLQWYSNLRLFGIDIPLTDAQKTDPANINKTLATLDKIVTDPIEKELLNLSLLRYMDKAKYGLENIGHFGLASTCYTHFTSPIRRYSDLMVHRYLKEYLFKKETAPKVLAANTKFIEKACLIINDTESNSVDTEREVIKVCMVEYMSKKIGQTFDGVVSSVLKFGVFIQLEDLVEGLVHISNLPNGTQYDEKTLTLTTPDNKSYRLGQRVKVKLIKADLKTRKIDFEFVE